MVGPEHGRVRTSPACARVSEIRIHSIRLPARVRTVALLDTRAPARVRRGVVKALPFGTALRVLRCIGLASLMLVVLVATTIGVTGTVGSSVSSVTGVASPRGDLPPLAHEHHQLDSNTQALVAFEQAADEPDEDPVLDIALDVAGWRVSTRALERVRSGEAQSRTTQVALRARPARGPPV
jgi:hypothetical protein